MASIETADPPPASGTPVPETKKSPPSTTPVPEPAPSVTVPARAELTAEEQKKYDWLLDRVRAISTVECPKAKDLSGPITDSEKIWLTRECIIRYLRATKWQEKDSEKRLMETLAWRREFGVEQLTPDHISPENETGKQLILGYDKEGRPCHYLNPGRQNTNASHRQVEHLVFMVERVLDIMPGGQETLSLMINFKQSKSRQNTAPGIGMARECLHILQMHYPERLGRALIINVPWVVWGFFKLITPLVDPRTREKLKFNEDMTQFVPAEHLWSEYQSQGGMDFDYDHSIYWPALLKLCEERREARMKRWVAAGKAVGEYEDYLFGRTEVSIGGEEGGSATTDASKQVNGKVEEEVTKPEDLKVGEIKIGEKMDANLDKAPAKQDETEEVKAS